MSIKITQTCDGCGEERELAASGYGTSDDLKQAARLHGWREVLDKKHLCLDCLRRAVDGGA